MKKLVSIDPYGIIDFKVAAGINIYLKTTDVTDSGTEIRKIKKVVRAIAQDTWACTAAFLLDGGRIHIKCLFSDEADALTVMLRFDNCRFYIWPTQLRYTIFRFE